MLLREKVDFVECKCLLSKLSMCKADLKAVQSYVGRIWLSEAEYRALRSCFEGNFYTVSRIGCIVCYLFGRIK